MGNDHERRPTVKQLLQLPSVQKAKTRRLRELTIRHYLQSLKATFEMVIWPLFVMLGVFLSFVFVKPFKWAKIKIQRCLHDSRMNTPVQQQLKSDGNGGFLVPFPPKRSAKSNGVSFSSDGKFFSWNYRSLTGIVTFLRLNSLCIIYGEICLLGLGGSSDAFKYGVKKCNFSLKSKNMIYVLSYRNWKMEKHDPTIGYLLSYIFEQIRRLEYIFLKSRTEALVIR